MLCERCNQKPASVHVTKYIDGKMTEIHLCSHCAEKEDPLSNCSEESFQDFLTAVLGMTTGVSKKPFKHAYDNASAKKCPSCQMTYDKFRTTGRFGCRKCYETFSPYIDTIFRKLHGNTKHMGKLPKRAGGSLKRKKELMQLKEQLKQAVKKEEFELAAKLRDQIRAIEREEI